MFFVPIYCTFSDSYCNIPTYKVYRYSSTGYGSGMSLFTKKNDDDCWYKRLVPNRDVHKKGFRTRLKKWIQHSV